MRKPAGRIRTSVTEQVLPPPWHSHGWFLDRFRELAFHLMGLRGLAFASSLLVAYIGALKFGKVPDGFDIVIGLTGAYYTGAYLVSKGIDARVGNGEGKPSRRGK